MNTRLSVEMERLVMDEKKDFFERNDISVCTRISKILPFFTVVFPIMFIMTKI